jgi:hypothetical protein
MIRCALLLAIVLFGAAVSAPAQAQRQFPASALRGELVVTAPPELQLNRKPARLAPGARIRGTDGMLILSGALVGQRMLVHYTIDLLGNVQDVWVLTPAEAAKQPWPTTPQEAATWRFSPDSQSWSKP